VSELDDLFEEFVVEAEVLIDATADQVWALVADVERIGEFSPECVGVE
jgi:ribosome-associated toxin RatA of RatAB toxin-antitoxin module